MSSIMCLPAVLRSSDRDPGGLPRHTRRSGCANHAVEARKAAELAQCRNRCGHLAGLFGRGRGCRDGWKLEHDVKLARQLS